MRSPVSLVAAFLVVLTGLLLWFSGPASTQSAEHLSLSEITSLTPIGKDVIRLEVAGRGLDSDTRFSLYRDFGNRRLVRGKLKLPSSVEDVVGRDHFLYLAGNDDGLVICDVSDPDRPVVESSLPLADKAWRLVLVDNLAVVLSQKNLLHFIDVSDPAHPVLSHTMKVPGFLEDIVCHGRYLYVSARERGVHVIDLKEPQNPMIKETIDTFDKALGLALRGRQLLVADDHQGVLVYEGVESGHLDLVERFRTPDKISRIASYSNEHIVASGSGGLYLQDADGHFSNITTDSIGSPSVGALAVHRGQIYMGTGNGIFVLSAQAGTTFDVVGFIANTSRVRKIFPFNNRIFWVDTHYGLQSIADDVAFHQLLTPSVTKKSVRKKIMGSGHVLFALSGDHGLQALERRQKDQFKTVGRLHEKWSALSFARGKDRVFVGVREEKVFTLDIDDDGLSVKGALKLPGKPVDMVVSGDQLLVADSVAGLLSFDITDPDHPDLVSALSSQGTASHICLAGEEIYLAEKHGGLMVARLSAEGHLEVVRRRMFPMEVIDVAASGQSVVVLFKNGQMEVLDKRDVGGPGRSLVLADSVTSINSYAGYLYARLFSGEVLVLSPAAVEAGEAIISSSIEMSFRHGRPRVQDGMLLLSESEGGGFIYSLENPAQPVLVEQIDSPRRIDDFSLADDYVLAQDRRSTLVLLPRVGVPSKKNDLLGDRGTALELAGDLSVLGSLDRLQVIDVSRPDRMEVLGSIKLPGRVNHVKILGEVVYAVVHNKGLYLVDISTPAAPRLLGVADFPRRSITPGIYSALDARDGLAVVVSGKDTLLTVDVNDPNKPRVHQVWKVPTPLGNFTIFQDVKFYRNHAYVADLFNGLFVFKVSSTGKLELVDHRMEFGGVSALYRHGNRLYLANKTEGVFILDLDHPSKLQVVGKLDELKNVVGLWASESELVVSIRHSAFYKLPVPVESSQVFNSGEGLIVDLKRPSEPGYYTLFATGLNGMDKKVGKIFVSEQGAASLQ